MGECNKTLTRFHLCLYLIKPNSWHLEITSWTSFTNYCDQPKPYDILFTDKLSDIVWYISCSESKHDNMWKWQVCSTTSNANNQPRANVDMGSTKLHPKSTRNTCTRQGGVLICKHSLEANNEVWYLPPIQAMTCS